jgi:hypothetical protein
MNHYLIEIGNRRWCLDCGAYQILRSGKWRDVPELLGPWPGYQPMKCDTPSLFSFRS